MIAKTFSKDIIPKNYRVIEDYVKVAGLKHHENELFKFISNSQSRMSIELELEPYNSFDKNAIKVIGIAKKFFYNQKYFIGYIPAEISAHISKMVGKTEIRQF